MRGRGRYTLLFNCWKGAHKATLCIKGNYAILHSLLHLALTWMHFSLSLGHDPGLQIRIFLDFSIPFIYIVWGWGHATARMWKSEYNLQNLVFSYHHVGIEGWIQVLSGTAGTFTCWAISLALQRYLLKCNTSKIVISQTFTTAETWWIGKSGDPTQRSANNIPWLHRNIWRLLELGPSWQVSRSTEISYTIYKVGSGERMFSQLRIRVEVKHMYVNYDSFNK